LPRPRHRRGQGPFGRNATRHGLCARTLVLHEGEDAADLAALRAAMLAHHQPLDEAEAHWVEELVFVAWRQRRLRVLEDAVLAQAVAGEPGAGLPSLATLIRYRGRLDRDARRATEELASLRRGRKDLPDLHRLRWLADCIEHAQSIAAYPPPDAKRTNEIDSRTNEPTGALSPAPATDPVDAVRVSANASKCTNEFPFGTDEPTVGAARLNRHERRRLAALARQRGREAA
jgi:hypothetical protein